MANQTKIAVDFYNEFIEFNHIVTSEAQRHISQMHERNIELQRIMSNINNLSENLTEDQKNTTDLIAKELLDGKYLGDRKVKTVQEIYDAVENRGKPLEVLSRSLIKKSDISKPNIKNKEISHCSKDRIVPSASSSTASKEQKKRNTEDDSNESLNDAKLTKRFRRNKADDPDYVAPLPVVQRSIAPMPRSTATPQVHIQSTSKKYKHKTETKTKKKNKYKKQQKENVQSSKIEVDIPIDPDEPTYCVCDQVSYGEMICCDNDLCPIEWFHFSCVSLVIKPKGKWFCPKCRADRSNIMKPKAQFLKELERYNKEREERA